MVEIFYNIWAKYRDLDYTFLRGELNSLIGEWLEAEKLNAPDPAPSSLPPGPSVEVVIRVESVPIEDLEQQPVANADKEATASNRMNIIEVLIGEVPSRVLVKTLIDLEVSPYLVLSLLFSLISSSLFLFFFFFFVYCCKGSCG